MNKEHDRPFIAFVAIFSFLLLAGIVVAFSEVAQAGNAPTVASFEHHAQPNSQIVN